MFNLTVAACIAATLMPFDQQESTRGLLLAQGGPAGVRSGRTATGIAYDVRGSGPVVVLLTGSNLDRRMWDREAAWRSAKEFDAAITAFLPNLAR